MKKFCFTILIGTLFFGLEPASAQSVDGAVRIGAHLGYGTDIESFGIGARGDYAVSPSILIAPDFMYYFGKSDFGFETNWFDINLNGNYLIEINNPDLVPYALAGLNVAVTSLKCDEILGALCNESNNTEIGLNLGGGMDYTVGMLILFSELRVVIGEASQVVIATGVKFPLN